MANDSSSAKPPEGDNTAQLISKLYADILSAAKAKQFTQAETLRNKLIELAPAALSEIIGSAEIIEKEKAEGIDRDHLAIWDKLYSTLSPEEQNALFYSMKKIVIPPKKIILSHGAYNTRLFFIDSGKVTIVFPKKGKNTVLAQLGKGNLLGEYSFTLISLCSATAVSHTEVELYCLDNAATDSWNEEYPGLCQRVTDFCLQHGSIEDIGSWKSLEKRNQQRYSVTGPVKATLLNKEGKKTETYFRGELIDLSVEGCGIEIKLSKKATARALLARSLYLQFLVEKDGKKMTFDMIGKIVKVSFYMHNDYSLHISFVKPISRKLLMNIAKQS